MIFALEKAFKKAVWNCQTCGQCILSYTAMKCPMNCPKGLRNGPCGGTLDGRCEVLPDQPCTWVGIEGRKGAKADRIHPPMAKELLNTASYVNLVTGRDRATRVPQPFHDTSAFTPTSRLAERMLAGRFTVTLEIASPRDAAGLPRVRRIAQAVAGLVDAVNTTTNAGGRPSLHSLETAAVIAEHGIEAVIQFCGRDHEPADLLAQVRRAVDLGHRNLLLLTGDWLPQAQRGRDQRHWFPMDSSQMIHLVAGELAGYAARGVVPYLGCASNPFTTPIEVSVDRLAFKRRAGARFSQTQAVTDTAVFARWYALVRRGREHDPRLVLPSLPLVGTPRGLEILRALPGVFVAPAYERALAAGADMAAASAAWALAAARELRAVGAAGVHLMNFGMPIERIAGLIADLRAEHDR